MLPPNALLNRAGAGHKEALIEHKAWEGAFDNTTKKGDNADKIFPRIAVDQAGQVHVALPVRHNDDPVGFVAACTVDANNCVENLEDTDLLLVTSPDNGEHWT